MESQFNLTPEPVPVTQRNALCALTAINQDIVLLDYANVVIRRDYQNLTSVRLLGGGIGGSDLNQAIFVGRGMLTAAILGEETVPSSRQILRTIKELNEGENCGIFVIAQSTSDLFNFGLAVERANSDCRTRVKLLSIDDDKSERKERYSCGFVLLIKILGAMVERGLLFEEIYDFYKDIIQCITTVPLNYLQEEVGHLRHKSITLTPDFATNIRGIIDKKSQFNLSLHPSIPIVVLINTSRSLDRFSELGLVNRVITQLRDWGVSLIRMYYGNFVSQVFSPASLTIMKIHNMRVVEYLDAQTDACGWQQVIQYLPEISLKNEVTGLLTHQGKQHIPLKGPKLKEPQNRILKRAVQFACDALISCERQLNTMDSEKSDGNVGTRLRKMSEHVTNRLKNEKLPVNCPYTFFKKLGVMAESAIGGTMGSIYGIFFESASAVFEDLPETDYVTPFVWARALSYATNSIREYCQGNLMETTMFYPIKCCEVGINQEIAKEQDYLQCYGIGVSIAEEAAQKTRLAKSTYPDAGAHAVGIWMRAVFEAVKLTSVSNWCENEQ